MTLQFLLCGWTIPVRVKTFAFFVLLQFKRKTPFTQSCAFLQCSHYERKNPKLLLFPVGIMHSIIVNNAADTYYTFWQYLSFIKVVTCLKAPIFVRSVSVMHQTKFPNMLNILLFFFKPFSFEHERLVCTCFTYHLWL